MSGTPLLPGIAPPDPLRRVPPAHPPPALQALAEQAPPGLRCGPSSWAYPGWGDRVWGRALPERELSRYGLPAVAAWPLFRAIGVDRTFHAPVSQDQYATWARQAPRARFLVKAPKALTTPAFDDGPNPDFLDAARALDEWATPAIAGLGGTLGHLLLQFSAGTTGQAGGARPFFDRLVALLEALPPDARPAVELRDPALVHPRTRDRLAEVGAVACLNVQPGMPPLAAQASALGQPDGPLVVRWMTRPGLSYQQARAAFSPFTHLRGADPGTRRALARLACRWLERDQGVLVTVANRAEGCTPLSVAGLVDAVVAIRRRRAR